MEKESGAPGAQKTKLKFRVTAKDGPSGRWSEKWGVSLLPHEEFHVTDQLLKLPFAKNPPETVCTFSVPRGRLVFQMTDDDRTASVNGQRQKKGQLKLGDKIQIGDHVVIEVIVAPAFLKEVIESSDGPTLITQLPKGDTKSITIKDTDEIPDIDSAALQEPTLTLSPMEKERIAAEEKSRHERAHQARQEINEGPKAVGLAKSPHPQKDHGINPDYIPDEGTQNLEEPAAAEDPGFQPVEPEEIPNAPEPVEAKDALVNNEDDDQRTRVVHAEEVMAPKEAMPIDDDRTVAYVRKPEPKEEAKLEEPKKEDPEPVRRLKEALKPKHAQTPQPVAPKSEPKSEPAPVQTKKPAPQPMQEAEISRPVEPAPAKHERHEKHSPKSEPKTEIHHAKADPVPVKPGGPVQSAVRPVLSKQTTEALEEARAQSHVQEESSLPANLSKPSIVASAGGKPGKKGADKPDAKLKVSIAEQVKAKIQSAVAHSKDQDIAEEMAEVAEANANLADEATRVHRQPEPWIPERSSFVSRLKNRTVAIVGSAVLAMGLGAFAFMKWQERASDAEEAAESAGQVADSADGAPAAALEPTENQHPDVSAEAPAMEAEPDSKPPTTTATTAAVTNAAPAAAPRNAPAASAPAANGSLTIEPLKKGMSIEELREQVNRLKAPPKPKR